jgi:hypothetical protein
MARSRFMSAGRRRWQLAAVWGAVATTAAAATPAGAEATVPTYVVSSNSPVFVQAQIRRSDPPIPGVPECEAVACKRAKLRVRLPSTLRNRPGGVQVAIRYPSGVFGDALGLYVRRGTTLVASSTGQVGTGQSVLLPKADQDYDIYVAYNPFIPEISTDVLSFQGMAENEDAQPVQPVRRLLPDLLVLSPRVATFEHPEPIFGDSAPDGQSCFSSEIGEQGASVCLRFGQRAANIGHGPVDVRWSVNADTPEDEVPAFQRVYRSDGTFRDQSAGSMHFHPIHNHYHFEDFTQSSLYVIAANGLPTGSAIAKGTKNGFCMADTEMYWWGLKGDAPMSYPAPRCLERLETIGGRDYFKNGMSRGWADEYGWDLPDQMIEASKVSDGTYMLVTRVDTENRLEEETDANTCIMVKVKLTNMASPSRTAALIGDSAPCRFS